MHRVLLAYESTAVHIFSLNKNRTIQTIDFSRYDRDKGNALSVDFLSNEAEAFIVGYSSGILGFYKTETSSQKPFRTVEIGK
jgi:hypothetical protein